MAWRVAQDPGTASSRYGTEAVPRQRAERKQLTSAWGKAKKIKKKLEFEGGMRDEVPHRVRRGYFNCAKSYLKLERGCNVKIFSSLCHIALKPFFSRYGGIWGSQKISFLSIVNYTVVHDDKICTFVAARSPNENSCQMETVAYWMR